MKFLVLPYAQNSKILTLRNNVPFPFYSYYVEYKPSNVIVLNSMSLIALITLSK